MHVFLTRHGCLSDKSGGRVRVCSQGPPAKVPGHPEGHGIHNPNEAGVRWQQSRPITVTTSLGSSEFTVLHKWKRTLEDGPVVSDSWLVRDCCTPPALNANRLCSSSGIRHCRLPSSLPTFQHLHWNSGLHLPLAPCLRTWPLPFTRCPHASLKEDFWELLEDEFGKCLCQQFMMNPLYHSSLPIY